MYVRFMVFLMSTWITCGSLYAGVVTVLELTDMVADQPISHWTGQWYNWAYNFPATEGEPIDDPDGALATRYQSDPVFQVAGTYGTTVTRSFQVRPDTHLLIPLVNAFSINVSDPVNIAQDEIDFVDNFIAGVDTLFFEVNGQGFGDTDYLKRYLQSDRFVPEFQGQVFEWDADTGQKL